jgi:hypothetical protein
LIAALVTSVTIKPGRLEVDRKAPATLLLRWVQRANVDGMKSYLYAAKVLLKDFKAYVQDATDEIRQATARTADAAGRPVIYLPSSTTRKEDVDVMRFLGRKVPQRGGVNGHFLGEVVTDVKERPEGMRIKHRLNRNSIKMYDKQSSVLRVETTINDARDMKVFRSKEGSAQGPKSWRRLRKGIADLHRRAQVSQAANERYLDSIAAVEDGTALGDLAGQLCQPAQWEGRRVRALNPFSLEDAHLLAAARRQASAVTRKLRLLRGHGLIRKVPKTHRYMLTDRGQSAIAALLAARQVNTAKLAQLAA